MNKETEIEKAEYTPAFNGEEQARTLSKDVPVFDVQKAEEASSFVELMEQGSLPDNPAMS